MKDKILFLKEGMKSCTLLYMWIASCLYFVNAGNINGANACFYSGLFYFILWILDSKKVKNK